MFFIRGNWGEHLQYNELVSATYQLPRVEEISGRIVVEFNNVRVLDILFYFSKYLQTCKRIDERFPEPVDIVLAHAELVRRI